MTGLWLYHVITSFVGEENMKGIILYRSKYGATKRYADWLAQETGFDCMETSKANIDDIKNYDAIILGGGIYASGIAGIGFLKKNMNKLQGKKVVVFCDGASPYEEDAFRQIVEHNMTGVLMDVPCFYCRGAWNMDAMSFADKTLCKMLQKAVGRKNPDDYEVWEKALMEAGDKTCDWTDKTYIEPILEAIK